MQKLLLTLLMTTLCLALSACQKDHFEAISDESNEASQDPNYDQSVPDPEQPEGAQEVPQNADHYHSDGSPGFEANTSNCTKASSTQLQNVMAGFDKKDLFIEQCLRETNNSSWCAQLVRPNPSSASKFRCTYGTYQPHYLINPDEKTWKNAIEAVKIIKDLSAKGIRVALIYNWWRPEPYNKNVGGAAGRHPYGTSIDVRFASNSEANRAFTELCKMRSQGRLRAIGHYGSSSLHIGVGDVTANTWGKSCS